ncbi:hypothetical protein PLESTB_000675600 [Pleodorina starrii]|uniref:Uncharacterized protein n=1 Tax=Pleodorina starrii TaxID=330485 RepID=A0A9W6BJA2_9CHLO|nr:hypothetical protein PLESTB_000675600 [Pleodorina starrii]
MLLTSVQLLIVPAAAAAADSGGGGVWPTAPAPVAGRRVAIGAAAAAETEAQRPQTRHTAAAAADQAHGSIYQQHDDHHHHHHHHSRGGLSAGLLAHGDGATATEVELAGSSGPWPSAGELPEGAAPLFAPSAVATDPAVRGAARAAAKAHLAAEAPSCPAVMEELAEATEALLEAAGPDGLTFAELYARLGKAADGGVALGGAEGSGGATAAEGAAASTDGAAAAPPPPSAPTAASTTLLTVSVPPTHHLVSLVLRGLELHGLARRVGGWDALHFKAAQHCRDAIVEVGGAAADAAAAAAGTAAADAAPAPATAPVAPEAQEAGPPPAAASGAAIEGMEPWTRTWARARARAGRRRTQRRGLPALGPLGRRPRPWAPARAPVQGGGAGSAGAGAAAMWDALLQRLLGLVMRQPGLPGELLVSSSDVIPPQAVRELLHHLAAHGRLAVRVVPPPPGLGQRPRQPLLLGGGSAGAAAAAATASSGGGGGGRQVVHYFPVLERYAGSSSLQVAPPP